MGQLESFCEGIKHGFDYSDSVFYYGGTSTPEVSIETMEKSVPKVRISGVKEEPLDLYIKELIAELQGNMLSSRFKQKSIKKALEQFSEIKFKDKNWWGSLSNNEIKDLVNKVRSVYSSQTLMLSEGLKEAYLFGKLHNVLTGSDSLKEARKQLLSYKQTGIDKAALEHIDGTANLFWDKAISREVDPITIRLLQHNRDATTGILKTYYTDPKKGWRSVSADIYHGVEKSHKVTLRDIDRITLTELSNAQNNGILHSLYEQGKETCFVIVRPTACKVCKEMFLNPDGSPKIFNIAEMMTVPRDANWGKRKGDLRVDQLPPIHPHDFCRVSSS